MKQVSIISLKYAFKKILITSIAIFLTVQLILSSVLFVYNSKTNQAYIKNNVIKTASNLDKYLNQIEKNGFSISSNYNFMSLYTTENSIPSTDAASNAYQTASQICTLTPSILDLIVVDLAGTKKSYFSGYDYSVIDELYNQNILNDPQNLDRSFLFFSNDAKFGKDYFLYYFPVLRFGTNLINAEKSATAVFVCSKQELNNYIMPEEDTFTTLSLYYKDLLLTSSSPNAKVSLQNSESHKSYIYKLKMPNFYVSGVSTSPFCFQKITILMCIYLALMIACFILFILYINRWIHHYVTTPITEVTTQLKAFNSGDLNKQILPTNVFEINDIIDTTNEMILSIKTITKKIFTTQDQLYETVLRKTEAELYALQSQINPHFLYNTLQCIRGLATLHRNDDIKEIALSMSDVFKYSIAPGTYVTFLEEIRIIHKYLSIYKIRFNGKIEYNLDIDEDILNCYTVKMIIQPTVENAVVHAFQDFTRNPTIHIIGQIEKDTILFQIIDNGNGIPHEVLQEIRKKLTMDFENSIKNKSSYGIGLYNINRRIKLAYGEEYGIEIFSNLNGTEVDIRIPLQHTPSENNLE